MNRYLITAAILSISWTSVICEPDLQQKNANHDDLNPLNEEANLTAKGQEKRTILDPTIKNYAWAKHVGVRPSGAKYVLGYSPVDLKYRPVLRPLALSHQGYHYNRPKFHFQLRKPIVHIPQVRPVLHTEWKPVVKPAVPIHVPPPSHLLTKPARPVVHVDEVKQDHLHLNPVPHVDHIHAQVPTVHVDHVHQSPVPHVDHVHKVPQFVHVQQVPVTPVDHIHQVPLAQVDHVHQVQQQVPWHPVNPVQTIQLVPQNPHIVPQTQFVPSAQLFEVTKPDLGVLPLGAVFQSPVLRDVPAPQFKPALVHQHLVPAPPVQHIQPVAPASIHLQQPVTHLQPVPSAQPVTHLHPVVPQPVAPVQTPQAFGQVEYHGTTNFINLRGQVPGNAVHNLLPNHYHLQYPQIPQAQVVPEFQIPRPAVFQQQVPHQGPVQVHPGSTGVFPHQQQLPLDTQPHFQSAGQAPSGLFPSQQQLPLDSQSHFQDAGRNVFQQQLPQTQTHFHVGQNSFQSDNDVQHVFPQDSFQQQLPQGNVQHQEGQNLFQQQLPQTQFQQHGQNNDVQHVFPQDGFQQQEPQQQLPQGNVQHEGRYQPADQVSSVQFYRPGQFQIGDQNDGQGYFYQRPENEEGGHSIQPGETDLQLPLHLPHHPGFEGTARQFQQDGSGEDSNRNEGDFRPSIQLEPPYEKK